MLRYYFQRSENHRFNAHMQFENAAKVLFDSVIKETQNVQTRSQVPAS